MADAYQREITTRNGLLLALPSEDLARLRSNLQPVDLPFGEILFPSDGAVTSVLFLESGMVSLVATLDDGDQVEVGIAGREGLVGLPLVFGDDRSLVEARVQMEGSALRLGAAAFRAEMERGGALRVLALRYAQAAQGQITMTAACNARHAIEQRLARWLLMAHDRAGGRQPLPDPRADLDDARRAPPRGDDRRRHAAKGRADPLRAGPDVRDRPAGPRSRHLRMLPHLET